MLILITTVISIFIFGLVVMIHELGHFICAKKAGIQVNEFSIGMGPALFSRVKNGTRYSIRALPVGGYVSMEGEDEESDDSSDEVEIESLPRRGRRSKLDQERPSSREKAIAQTDQSSKRPRTSSPTQTEKVSKHLKVAERSLGRRCRRLRLTSPSLLRECLPLYSLDAPCCLFFLI